MTPSKPDNLPEAPPPNTITLKVGLQYRNLEGLTHTNLQSIEKRCKNVKGNDKIVTIFAGDEPSI